jgi:hypothetical protein
LWRCLHRFLYRRSYHGDNPNQPRGILMPTQYVCPHGGSKKIKKEVSLP